MPFRRPAHGPRRNYRLADARPQRRAVPARRAPVPRPPALRRRARSSPARRPRPAADAARRRAEAWLKRGLEGSRATWKLIGNQLMIMALDTVPGAPINRDQWDGYGTRAPRDLQHVVDRGVKDVAFLTGDIHTFFAGDVGVDGRGPESVATEFVGGSVTSLGDSGDGAGRDRRADPARAADRSDQPAADGQPAPQVRRAAEPRLRRARQRATPSCASSSRPSTRCSARPRPARSARSGSRAASRAGDRDLASKLSIALTPCGRRSDPRRRPGRRSDRAGAGRRSPARPLPAGRGGGRADQRGVTLWTRLEGYRRPPPAVEVARDADFRRVVLPPQGEARGAPRTPRQAARAPRLQPGERYFYRFETRDEADPVGRFRTLRPPDSREPVRIAFWSCQD